MNTLRAKPTGIGTTGRPIRSLACDDVVVLRSVTLGVALTVLAAACGLVEEPPPPSTGPGPFQVQIWNTRADPVELTITTPEDMAVVGGVVRPALLPALSETTVTFHVPIRGEWALAVNGVDQLLFHTVPIPNIDVCGLEIDEDNVEIRCP